MTFSGEDLFVGSVAVVLGGAGVYAAWTENAWFFALAKVRWLDSRLGRSRARWVCTALAATLIVLGGAIAFGYAPNRLYESGQQSLRNRPSQPIPTS